MNYQNLKKIILAMSKGSFHSIVWERTMKTKKAYAGMMDKSPLVFSIPVFENMPAGNSPMPG